MDTTCPRNLLMLHRPLFLSQCPMSPCPLRSQEKITPQENNSEKKPAKGEAIIFTYARAHKKVKSLWESTDLKKEYKKS